MNTHRSALKGCQVASLPKGSKPGECRVDGVFCFLADQTKSRNPGQRHQSRKAYPHHLKSKQSITYIYQLKGLKSIWSREFQKHSLVSCKEPGVRVRYYSPWAGWFDQGLCSGLPSPRHCCLSCSIYHLWMVYGRAAEAMVSIPAHVGLGFWWGKYRHMHMKEVSRWSHSAHLQTMAMVSPGWV